MHPVVVKSCGHRMWSLVVSIKKNVMSLEVGITVQLM